MSIKTNEKWTTVDEFFVCQCGTDSHTLRLTLEVDEDEADAYRMPPELTASLHLRAFPSVWKRLWYAMLYVLNLGTDGRSYWPRYGHWDTWMMSVQDADRLIGMATLFKSESRMSERDRSKEDERVAAEKAAQGAKS